MERMEKKLLEKKAVAMFLSNSSWREEYDKAPSRLMKVYKKASFILSCYAGDEAMRKHYSKLGKRLEKSFSEVEWDYMLASAASNTAKAYWSSRKKALCSKM